MVNMGELFAYPRIMDQPMELVPMDEREQEVFALEVGDLLFARQSLVAEGAGKCSIVMAVPELTTWESHIIRVRLDQTKADPLFYYYYFSSYIGHGNIQSLVMQVAAAGIRGSDLQLLQVPLPPLPTQRRIAAILSAYDDLIENNSRRIKALEQAAHDLYREWFVEFRFPGHESVPLVDSSTEYGMIPQGWGVGCLGNIAEDKRNSIHPSELESDMPYVGLEHIPRKTIALSEWGQAGDVNSTKLIFEVGDILFAKIRPYLHKVAVAPMNGVSSTDAIIIVPKSSEFYALVLMCVSGEHFVEYATTTSQGTQMPRANWKVLAEYPVVIPSSELLREFNEFVIDIVNDIQTNIFRNNALREARDLLLPRLVSGELSVEDVPHP
jgi:type I restriction enzyme S subunit